MVERLSCTRFGHVLLYACLIGVAGPAIADQGDGSWTGGGWSLASRTGAKPIDRLGEDVIRFSAAPALGGPASIVELHPLDSDWAGGEVRFYTGHPRLGWQATGRLTIRIRRARYDALAAGVDAALSKGEPTGDAMEICTDGPGWVTERRASGRSRWLSGFCGDHPNVIVHRLVWQVVTEQVTQSGG